MVKMGKLQIIGSTGNLKEMAPNSAIEHRNLRKDEFWQAIPVWKNIDEVTFLSHTWQEKNAITSVDRLMAAVRDLVSAEFIADVQAGFDAAPMAVRISPYLLSLINWSNPYTDPIRRQFLPVGSQLEADHPMLTLDSLHEQDDSPVPGLTHRYADKVLFLALDTCPVYCRFCTRSYAVGLDTDTVEKVSIKADEDRWSRIFEYIESRPEVEDVVVSGGDSYRLRADQIRAIGERLLAIPHVRRWRYATKGLAIQPMKVLSDAAWTDAICDIAARGRQLHKEVVIHTHFNHPAEITAISARACNLLMERGVTVRNQSVLQRGVNDSVEVMQLLVKRLSWINVHPYYVYVHDLVRGTEDLRTPVSAALEIEKGVRGSTAGFNTPVFVVDAPGGGGKRDAHSFEHYDRHSGISVYSAPSVKYGELFCYYDPLTSLSESARADWNNPTKQGEMIQAAKNSVKK